MTERIDANRREVCKLLCRQPECGRRIPLYAESIVSVLLRGKVAEITADSSPAAGKDQVPYCERDDCGASFVDVSTENPLDVQWLEENVPEARIVRVPVGDEVVIFQRDRT